MDFSSNTNGVNILSPGSNHRSIDNDQVSNIVSNINNQIKGNNAVKSASSIKQKVNNPDKSSNVISK